MGLIHLYSATSTSFDDNGTPLVTAREAVVKRDEGFQLTFNIPISQNDLHKRVQKEMIVSAMTPDGVNYFRIWDIEKRTTDVKVTALQLLYSLDVKKINPFGGKQHTGDSVLQAFANSFKSSIAPYTFSSSILTLRDFHTNEEDDTSTSHNALAILNKITDHWSGELMLNGFDVRMVSKLGTKTDALLYEHKNIASFSDSSSMNGIVTRIYATATYTPERAEGAKEDPEPVVLTATVDSPLINQYAVIYEATMEYNDARTVDELRTEILKQYSEFNVDKPERTIEVDTNIVDGTAINFGDELVLKYLVHDVDEVIRCVGYEYDPISENYIGVTLGTLEKTFLTKVTEGISSSVSSQIDKINRDIQGIQTAANGKNRIAYGPNPVPNAIEGDLWFYHPEGRPDEVELLVYQNGLWLPAPFLTDQDKAQFEQEMADHYDAAIAEVERKDAEYKEIFDGYDEKVLTIDQEIEDAATKAQNALEKAGISTDLAQTAKDLATTAQTNASSAITNANQAKADASTAVTNANQAKADAQTAMDDASEALENASLAKTDASKAVTDASKAVTDANTAKTNAQTAITNANTAITNANQAKTDSQTALTNANQAKEDASQALTNAGTAMTNASQAKTDASKAVTDAQTAITQSGQALSSANTAKTNAQTAIDDAQSALTTAGNAKSATDALTITVNDLEGEVELKASQTEVDDISGTVSTNTTTIGQHATAIASKADKTVLDKLSGTVTNQGTLITQNATAIESKASQTQVDVIKGTVDNHTTDISQNATDIATKASASSVNTLTGRVDTAESNISQNATAISQRVTTTTYNAGIASKENAVLKQNTAPTHANGKLWLDTSVTPNVLKRSNGTAWIKATPTTASEVGAYSQSDGSGLAGRLTTAETNITQTSTAITSKADKSVVDTLSGTVSTHTTTLSQQATAIASKADKTVVDTLSGTVDNNTTEIAQNATDIATKASASSVNTLTGRVNTAESNISQNATAISQRVTTTTYNAGIASKENTVLKQSAAPAHLNGRLWLDTSVTPNVLKRSTGTAWVKATPTTPGEVGAYSQSDGAGLAGRLTTAETNITQTATAITSKADKSVVDTLSGTVDTHTTEIAQNATAIASKASSASVNTLTGRVDTAETNISQNATAIASKASTSSVNSLTGRVDTAESNISQNATAISQRVTTTTYNSGISSKENTVLKQSTAPSHSNGRLWLDTSVTPNVLKRSTGSAWVKATPTTASEVGAYSASQGSTLAGRVTTAETNITQTATAITSKADKSVVDALSGTVDTHTTEISQNATAIASKASTSSVNTLTGRVSTAETTISQHATAISSKASQTEVDTVKGTVAGHTSTLSQHASQISARLTSSEVNSLVDGKGFSTINYVDNQITASANGIRADMSVVEGKIDGLEIGARNLFLNSDREFPSTRHLVINTYNIVSHLVGQPVTVSFDIKLGDGGISRPIIIYRYQGSGISPNVNGSVTPTTEWVRYSFTGIVLETAVPAGYTLGSVATYDSAGSNNYILRRIKIEKGNIATDWTLAPEDTMMQNDFNTFKASYEATAQSLTSRITAVDKVGGRLSTAETNISQNATAIASKASQTEVDTVKGTVSGHTTTLSQHATQIASKANTSTVNTLTGRVSTAETNISQNATAISSKASTSSVNTLTGRVSTAESNISQNATAISARLTSSQVNSLVDGKGFATQTWANNQIAATANSFGIEMTRVEGKIDGLQVGGRNLLTGTSESEQEATAEYWSLGQWNPGLIIGEEYTFSFDIKSENATFLTSIFLNSSNNGLAANTPVSKEWTRVSLTFIWKGGTYNGIEFVPHLYPKPSYVGTYVSRIKLEKGNIATDWTPAPEDTVMESDFTVFKSSYQNTVDAINTELSKTAKTTDLNGMVTESTLATKNFVTAGTMTTTLSNYAQKNNVPTNTQFNTLKNSYDSMVQAIGTNGSKIAQIVMTDSVYQTSIRKAGRNLLKNSYGRIANPDRLHSSFPVKDPITNGTRVTLSFKASSGTNQVIQIFNTNSYYLYGDVVVTKGTTESVYHISFTWNTNSNGGSTIDINNQFLRIYNKLEPNPTAYIILQWAVLQYGEIGTEHYISDDEDFETQVTQLADSWALTLKSGNDIKTQINATTNGIRLESKLIHLSGDTLIDNATIKSAHIDTLNANKIVGNTAEFNTIRTGVLIANAVTSTHINANTAFFDKVFSTTSATDRLSAQTAWIKDANIIAINASKITAGTISAARISTSSLANIELGGRNYAQGTTDKMQYDLPISTYSGTLVPNNASKNVYTLADLGAKVGDTYTASIYIGAGGGYGSGVAVYNQTGYPQYNSPTVAHAYTSVTFTVRPTDTEFRFYFAKGTGSGQTHYRIEACKFKIERGNKRTDWTQNPDDFGISGRVEIHGGNIKADTLDVGAITGDKATFISKGFKSLNSQSTINGHAIRIQNSAGEFVEMNNTPELRSDDAGGTAVVLGKGRVHFYDSRGYSKGYVGCDIHTAGSYDFGTFLSKGSGIYRFARMADATQTTYAYYTVKAGITSPSGIITNMVQNGYLPDGNAQQFVAKGNMISQLNGWPNYPNWPTLTAGQQIRYKEVTSQTTGDAYEDIWKFGPSSQGDWRIYFAKHATFQGGTTGTSDRRLKHDIETTQIEALGHIESLAFKEFRWNRDNKYEPLGLIAQDSGLLRVSDDDMEGIDIQRSIMLGLKGVQELQEIVKEQAEKIKQLEEIINQ